MNRVIRQPTLAAAPRLLDASAPAFLDADAEAMLVRAADDAYRRGHAEGLAAGRQAAADTATRVAAALEQAVAALRDMHTANAASAVATALEIAELILGHAPHDEGAALGRRVQEALGAVEDGELRLYANPADHDALAAALAGHADITLQTDPSLQPGEARLRGRWASVDFTRGAALTAVREALS